MRDDPRSVHGAGGREAHGQGVGTGDGHAGLECAGGRCIALGDDPFVCTNRCASGKDCGSGFICEQIAENHKECIPGNNPYTCK